MKGYSHMTNLEAVIFDMDGVIFDTERLCLESWKQAGVKYGLTDIDEVFPSCIGSTKEVTRRLFLERYGENFPYVQFRADAAVFFRQASIPNGFPKKKGIIRLLTYLKERGIKTGVASSTALDLVKNELEDAGLLHFFDVVIGGDCVTHSKPHPEIFLHCAELLGAKKETSLIIEDSYNGVKAAGAAGIRCIMVPDMLPPTDETNAIAWKTLPSLDEVAELLQMES